MDLAPTKHCGGCRLTKPLAEFNKNSRRADGASIQCKSCNKAYHRKRMECPEYRARKRENKLKWYAENGAAAKARWYPTTAAWKKANPDKQRAYIHKRRAAKRLSGGSYSSEDVANRIKWQRGKCACCNKRLGAEYHADHITPLALGGSSNPSNLQILCVTCNCSKGGRDPIQFMQMQGRLL